MSGLSRCSSFLKRASSSFPVERIYGEVQGTGTPELKRQKRDGRRIFLVRHGQSMGNVRPQVYRETADHAIELSEEGKRQALEAGQFLRELLIDENRSVKILVSPYKRARNTAEIIRSALGEMKIEEKEMVELGEIQFGLFEGLSLKQIAKSHPLENEHFTKCISHGGRFYARFPLGESRCDVVLRTKAVVDEILNCSEEDAPHDWIIVSHGLTLRAFLQNWLSRSVEWLEVQPNPNNCSVRLISEAHQDQGYVFPGFESVRAERHEEQEKPLSNQDILARLEALESEIKELKQLLHIEQK